MCVILIKDKKISTENFNKNELQSHYAKNNHGAGICCINNHKVWVPYKWGPGTDFGDIWCKIDELQKKPEVETLIIHFRYASVGPVTAKQAHPHAIFDNQLYLIHNGTFRGINVSEDESDTQAMCKLLSKTNIYQRLLDDEQQKKIAKLFFKNNDDNRVVLAWPGNYLIFNSHGQNRDGYWYSDGIWRCGSLAQNINLKATSNKHNYANIRKVNSFEKIYDPNCKFIILGTSPGKDSVRNGYYYASSNNSFWWIMNKIFNIHIPMNKSQFELNTVPDLLKNHVGIWDVCKYCEYYLDSSKDSNLDLDSIIPNRIRQLLSANPNLIFLCNGKTAYDVFTKKFPDLKAIQLDSSSNLYSKSRELKAEQWKKYII